MIQDYYCGFHHRGPNGIYGTPRDYARYVNRWGIRTLCLNSNITRSKFKIRNSFGGLSCAPITSFDGCRNADPNRTVYTVTVALMIRPSLPEFQPTTARIRVEPWQNMTSNQLISGDRVILFLYGLIQTA
ncbi:hypothetical protein N7522_012569 [Penicillium canescens]|nr:hypothetical protein N7522_012569 [Penicillium canescens]